MSQRFTRAVTALAFVGTSILGAAAAQAITAYGVDANGTLFNFNVNTPALVNTVGNLGFVPEGIDFRPGTNTLYAIDIGSTTSQLYTVNTSTGAATAVGTGFDSSGAGYDLNAAADFGFDFNPRTLQADGSVRIRLVSDNDDNLRLNSNTGGIATVDTTLAYGPADVNLNIDPSVTAAAYINSAQSTLPAAGTTTLFDIDVNLNILATQNPPNSGTLNTVGSLGFNATGLVGFDIYSDPNSNDDSIAGDTAYAVFTLPDFTEDTAYGLYSINLATGAASGGTQVGLGADFTGGFALTNDPVGAAVPEPLTGGLAVMSLVTLAGLATRRRA